MAKKARPLPGSWVDAWCRGSDLPSGVRCILFALANYMDQRGVCWPSLTTLARDTALDRRHVYRLLATAEKAGWIERHRGAGPKGNGGRSTLYRSAIPQGRDTDAPTSEGRDIEAEGRDIHDSKVGAPMSPERPLERPEGTSRTELADSENPPSISVKAWETIIERRDPWQLAFQELDGLTHTEAKWLLRGLAAAEHEEYVATDMEGPIELVALALYGMQRKPPFRWSRQRFVGFLSKAIAVRMDPTGHGEPDTDIEDAIRRCWA